MNTTQVESHSAEVDEPPDTSVIDRLSSMERARCRIVFEEYELAVELLRERVTERLVAGLPQERWEIGVAAEIGLALRTSVTKATGLLSRGRELHTNLRHTRERLRDGDLAPEAVPIIVHGLSHLDEELRREADAVLCADPATLAGVGLGRLHDKVEQVAYQLDKQGTVDRKAQAEKNRRVTIRPVPDGLARISLLLPLAQAVGAYAALRKTADSLAGVGTEVRNRAQIMADTAFARLTGREAVSGQPVTVNLTMPAEVLLGGAPGTAHLRDGGSLPAEIARTIVGRATGAGLAWVKRLYVTPETGAVVGLDSRARRFPEGLADLIAARDQYCRTPYCDAPIAHTDHVRRHATGGPTDLENGQGLCAACNYAKEGLGWQSRQVEDPSGRHTVETRTPSGHVHRSTAPRHAA